MTMKKNIIGNASSVLFLVLAAAGCQGMDKSGNAGVYGLNSNNNNGGTTVDPGIQVGPPPAEGKVASVSHFREVLPTLAASLGVVPSQSCVDTVASMKASNPLYGKVDELSPPTTMSYAVAGACLCGDLINKEKAMSAGSRTYFASLNFSGTNSSEVILDQPLKRLAGSLWNQQPSNADISSIRSGLSNVSLTGTALSAANSEKAALFVCTAVASMVHAQTVQ
jgi:hypothetical protein